MTSQNPINVDSMVGQSKCPICYKMKDSMFSFLCGHIVCGDVCKGLLPTVTQPLRSRIRDPVKCPTCTNVQGRATLRQIFFLVSPHTSQAPLKEAERQLKEVLEDKAERSRVIEELGKEIKQNSKSLAEINAHIDQLAKMRGKLTGEHRETTP
ncbi:hypothetical protein RhiXN_08811 [Rhizoctonia solani]|uniref:RING-type domain-containing protein n=1 Tax=Rhizoctonia solani TaxID=456999 RepID=A0A8H8NWU9_9AGAM|nr:uncharacterized protein RhiXN_08811 [Rhizoctonia solani]QRW19836.1 hypothetical protein RhiXN_08811 [Rhizoctonia solani]